jgi:pimeloyl-ACP methyl ester carboxylesterase
MPTSLPVPVEQRRLDVGEVSLNVALAGPEDGPLIILLHGFPEFWFGWRRQIPALAEAGFRVAAPDQRGYGESEKPEGARSYALDRVSGDVVGLADALGRSSFGLVGHDWGGLAAWATAARYPHQVERLAVLNAPHARAMRRALQRDPLQHLRSAYVGFFQLRGLPEAMLSAHGHRALARSLTGTSRPGTFSEEELEAYRRAWSRPGALTAMLNWYRALGQGEPPPSRIRPSALLLWGEKDQFLGRSTAEATLELCDDGRALWFPTATHWLHLEEPQSVNAALLGHFQGT